MNKNYVIYKICCEDLNITYVYIGSTNNFKMRKCQHKSKTTNNHKLKLYNIINENGGWTNWTMKPIEEFECETKIQARIREQYWIDKYRDSIVNINKAYISEEQKKEQIIEYNKQHYELNKEQRKELIKDYREQHKDEANQYNKLYYNNNKDYYKQYYLKNKEKYYLNSKTKKALKSSEELESEIKSL